MKISIRRTILLTSLGLGLLTLAASLLLISFTSRIRNASEKIGASLESVRIAEELQVHMLNLNKELLLAQLTKNPDNFRNANREAYLVESKLARSRQYASDETEQKLIDQLSEKTNQFLLNINQVTPNLATEAYLSRKDELQGALDLAASLSDINLQQSRDLLAKTASADKSANLMGITTSLLAFLTLSGLWFSLRFWIYKPVTELCKVMTDYSNDDSVRAKPMKTEEFDVVSQRFNDLADRLAEQKKSQLVFLASVAHDLKNPLGAIQMASEVLQEEETSPDERREFSGIVSRQAKHLEKLVEDLLSSTRIEAGDFQIEKQKSDLLSIVRDSVTLHQSLSKIHDISVEAKADQLLCECDSARVTQVVNNLISNAIKYSPNGGKIDIQVGSAESFAIIEVKDQGIGIAEKDQPQIFKPFQRTALTKLSIPGVGLGLSVSKKIIEAHGGKLSIESSVGQGSTFRVSVPLHQ